MTKPSVAELLTASGYTTFTDTLLARAISALYGNVGANLDGRDWTAIMRDPSPLQAAETALAAMYQDSAYLQRNATSLVAIGYVPAQAEYTYRQMGERLSFAYKSDWSKGSSFESLASLSNDQLIALVPPPPPPPQVSLAGALDGLTITTNVAGKILLSGSGELGTFAAGSAALSEQASIKQGYATLTANGMTSPATSQFLVLGTAGNDVIDTRSGGERVDYIFGGAGSDTIIGGPGADIVFGGGGDDTFEFFFAGGFFSNGAVTDQIDGGSGDNTIVIKGPGFTLDAATSFASVKNIHFLAAGSDVSSAPISITLGSSAFAAGIYGVSLAADTIAGGSNTIDASAAPVSHPGMILTGSAGPDTITGSGKGDRISGGGGMDRLIGGTGADEIATGAADGAVDTIVYRASGETATGLFTNGGSTTGMDVIAEVGPGDVVDLWDVFTATPTFLTNLLSTTTANQVALVRGSYNANEQTFSTATSDDYLLQWSDGTSVHSTVIKDVGTTVSAVSVDATEDTITFLDRTGPQMVSATYGGNTLVVTYDEPLTGTPNASDYRFDAGGRPAAGLTAVVGTGDASNTVTVTINRVIDTPVWINQLTYIASSGGLKDSYGNSAGFQELRSGFSYVNYAPFMVSAELANTDANDTALTITYGEFVRGTVEAGDFAVYLTGSNVPLTPSGALIDGRRIVLTLPDSPGTASVDSISYVASAGTPNSIGDGSLYSLDQTLSSSITKVFTELSGRTVTGSAGVDQFVVLASDQEAVINSFTSGSDRLNISSFSAVYGAGFDTTVGPDDLGVELWASWNYFVSSSNAEAADTVANAATYFQSKFASADVTGVAYLVLSDNDSTAIYKYEDSGDDQLISVADLTLIATIGSATTVSDYVFA